MMDQLWLLLVCAAAYAPFHWTFFQYAAVILKEASPAFWKLLVSFLVNYLAFTLMTMFRLHLCLNWSLVFLLFLIEVLVFFRKKRISASLIALDGASIGLAANIFTRCLASILLNRPLSHFDNSMDFSVNIKAIPVSLAFLLAALLLFLLRRVSNYIAETLIHEEALASWALLLLNVILYLFLILNLTAYYTDGNQLSMKLWGIKSAVFVLFCRSAILYYLIRLLQVRQFQEQIQQDRAQLLLQKEKSEQIHSLAFTDMLTGCYNRAYVEEVFAQLEESDTDCTLCFLDLDCLKNANDTYGHMAGDQYLRLVSDLLRSCMEHTASTLFRYGGDEFLILYENESDDSISLCISELKRQLAAHSHTQEYPYPMSISHGIASRKEAKNLHEVLKLADSRMYEEKRAQKQSREYPREHAS